MSEHDPYGPGTGPLRTPAPPPFDRPGFDPDRGEHGYPAAGSPPPGYGYGYGLGPQRTNVMAVLGLVFAFLFSPLGIVFSAIGLGQIRKRGENGRGLALSGLIVSIVLLAISAVGIAVAVSSPAFRAAYDSARASASSAAAGAPAQGATAQDGTATAGSGGDASGVETACRTIVPALMNLEAQLQDVRTPAQYGQALATLESTLTTAAGGASDPRFQQDVAQLNADLDKASAAVQAGKDPSSLESALNTDGQAVGEACAGAGFTN